jgi:hypothetical protein
MTACARSDPGSDLRSRSGRDRCDEDLRLAHAPFPISLSSPRTGRDARWERAIEAEEIWGAFRVIGARYFLGFIVVREASSRPRYCNSSLAMT